MTDAPAPRVLNVGGGHKGIALPPPYADFEQVLLDIDPSGQPDIVCDARELATLAPAQFEAVYCSHNLEHYREHEVPRVLAGFLHVLKPGGWLQVRVPDLEEVFRQVVVRKLDPTDVLYISPAGPIRVLDVVYGLTSEIARSGQDWYAHKTGFSARSLQRALEAAGFGRSFTARGNLEVNMIAFKGDPDPDALRRFGLPAG